MIVMFTGHRPNKLGGYNRAPLHDWVAQRIRDALVRLRPEGAICGMALGVDQWAAVACIDLGIPFIAAVPFPSQASRWPEGSRREHARLLAAADEVKMVSDVDPVNDADAAEMLKARNTWMVMRSDHVIAVWNGTPGGTANAVQSARNWAMPITRIDPREFRG